VFSEVLCYLQSTRGVRMGYTLCWRLEYSDGVNSALQNGEGDELKYDIMIKFNLRY
jgi:hypothetical protein